MVERSKHSVTARGRALLVAGPRQRHLEFPDAVAAYSTFYGLIMRDVHVRLLLGDALEQGEEDFAVQAKTAVNRFYRLYGTERSVEVLSPS
ncbi:MAG: TetR/AcrR family transcriptional regulator C-terminal domain-containing protein [Breoghania sp.]|nr:TetR/AcrR family transcriptional regulator C-terminal domain-containing protein [Breoghania sp.]MDJ0931201.1 TetR/AcrR family transcriptional regulator C-terminal domain-containing protein [Breoghania sp.]